jgi:hypothetical protein
MKMSEVLTAGQHRITEGSEYGWSCFHNARILDISLPGDRNNQVSVVYSALTFDVYVIETYFNKIAYRWVDPKVEAAYKAEYAARNIEYKFAYDKTEFTNIPSGEIMLRFIKQFAYKGEDKMSESDDAEMFPTANDYVDDHAGEKNTKSYSVAVDVRYYVDVNNAINMEYAKAAAINFANGMKPSISGGANVCWIDTQVVKYSVAETLVQDN